MQNFTVCGHQIASGTKKQVKLEAVTGCTLPMIAINGASPGKTVLITGATHGDEYPGIAAAIQTASRIDPSRVAGRILIFPCINPSGFWARSRYVAEDGANLNANFPGKADGTLGERIADFFVQEIFPQTDFLIDLHSGSAMEPLTPCLFFAATASANVVQTALQAAQSTHIPYLIASSSSSGLFSYAAVALGIPSLLLERGHSGLCLDTWVIDYARDIRLLLDHLGVYASDTDKTVCAKQIFHKSVYLSAAQDGLWYPAVVEDDQVVEGQLLGRLEDFFGNLIAEYRAEATGIVFYYTASLAVQQTQPLVAYGLAEYAQSQ